MQPETLKNPYAWENAAFLNLYFPIFLLRTGVHLEGKVRLPEMVEKMLPIGH